MIFERLKRKFLNINSVIAEAIRDSEKEIVAIMQEQWQAGLTTGDGRMPSGRQVKKIVPEYAESTKKKKRRLGQPTDRVTLFETGKYYSKITIEVFHDRFRIDSPVNPSFYLIKHYGEQIESPNRDSIEKIRRVILPKVMKRL